MKSKMFEELQDSVHEMDDIVKGKRQAARETEFPAPDVRKIRERLNYTCDDFAILLGVSPRTLDDWEKGRREPTGAARSLLRVAQYSPDAVKAALTPHRVISK